MKALHYKNEILHYKLKPNKMLFTKYINIQ